MPTLGPIKRNDGKVAYRFDTAQMSANGKLVPRRAKRMKSDIEGRCSYYIRYSDPKTGKRPFDPVGKSAIEALAAANRKEIELLSANFAAPVTEAKPDANAKYTRLKIANSMQKYLAGFASLEHQSTFLAYRRSLDIFAGVAFQCGHEYVDQIDEETLRAFLKRLRSEYDVDTVYHRFHYCEFWLSRNGKGKLLPKPERPKKRPVDEDGTDIATYQDGEPEKLVEAAETERDKLAILVGCEAGLRKGEAAHLERNDILDGQIVVRKKKPEYRWKPKTGRGRTIDVPRWLIERLQLYVAFLPPDQKLLFPNGDGGPDRHLEYMVNDLAEKVGVKVPSTASGERQPYHGLRSYFAIQRLRQGHDLNTVRRWGGWSDLKIMLRYLSKARGISEDARRLLDDGKVA